jgi:Two component regulator propeller
MRNPFNVFTDVLIDDLGTKWFANFNRFEPESPVGFYYYNEHYALPGTSAGWGKLSATDGLTSDKVWCLALDREGGVWVGSDQGITIIFDPTNPRQRMAAYHPLRDQIVQGIAVDVCDNKWVATKRGVFVLSPDGTSITDSYTVESTEGRLVDDDVNSIAIDNNSGTVYFATEMGLSTLKTAAVEPKAAFDELVFAPNPYIIPSSSELTVEGLVRSSSIKILTVAGDLVRDLQCPCGSVGFWDGRDDRGDLVASGVYLIVAYAEDGAKIATGKLALIRK